MKEEDLEKLINRKTYPWIYSRAERDSNKAIEWAFAAGYYQGEINELKRQVNKLKTK